MRARWTLWTLCGLCACAGGVAPPHDPALTEGARAESREIPWRRTTSATNPAGLTFHVRPGRAAPDVAFATSPAVAATALTPPEAETVLARLPALAPAPTTPFALPTDSRPAPIAAKTVDRPFPPPGTKDRPDRPAPEPPEVVRRRPQGEVGPVPQVTVTFSNPVAPNTDARALAPAEAPFTLTPQVTGEWRWLSAQTVVFEPTADRLPMATSYRVTSRSGWKSADGLGFTEPMKWSFSTARPKVAAWFPQGDRVALDTLQAVVIDQPIDPATLLPRLQVSVDGRAVPVRLATTAERAASDADGPWTEPDLAERTVVFKTVTPFAPNAKVKVRLAAGWRSREGPRPAEQTGTHAFSTYPPLTVTEHRCGWRERCPPLAPFNIEMSNPIEADSIAGIQVTPSVSGLRTEVFGRSISLRGLTAGQTDYRVTLPASVTDTFGQTLGAAKTVTFTVGGAEPRLTAAGDRLMVLDPDRSDAFEVFTINYPRLAMRAWRVGPDDWNRMLAAERRSGRDTGLGRPAVSRTITTSTATDQLVGTQIDLTPIIGDGPGHAVVELTPPPADLTGWRKDNPPTIRRWVQRTGLGLQVRIDRKQLLAWVSRLKTGAPVAGAVVRLLPTARTATTDAQGLARIPLPTDRPAAGALVTATVGDDAVFVPEAIWSRSTSQWFDNGEDERIRAFIFDDRRLYRPGETVHVKGWLRRATTGPEGDLAALGDRIRGLDAIVYDARNAELVRKTVSVNAWGGFDLRFDLPADANLGPARITFRGTGPKAGALDYLAHSFDVQAFRRPEFEVEVRSQDPVALLGEYVSLTAQAGYYAGGPLPDAAVRWRVDAAPTTYRPPGHSGYVFGRWVPWWRTLESSNGIRSAGPKSLKQYRGRTDERGQAHLRVDLEGLSIPQPTRLSAQASVSDVNRQTWSGETSVLVHPAALYVGLKSDRGFAEAGEAIDAEGIVVDIDGRLRTGRTVTATLAEVVYKRVGDRYEEVEEDPRSCRVTSDAQGRFGCRFVPPRAGRFRLTAEVRDDRGRPNVTTRTFWVFGAQPTPDRGVRGDRVTLVPDRPRYRPKDVARVLVQAPFPDGEGLLTVERDGVATVQRFKMTGASHVLEVPVAERFLPSVSVAVELVGRAPREGSPLPRPAFASGRVQLDVEDAHRRLKVDVTPAAAVTEPGTETSIAVRVSDANGGPVTDAEVAVVVVDEAVLALTAAKTPDPMAAFYPAPAPGVRSYRTRSRIVLASPAQLAANVSPPTPEAQAAVAGAGRMERKMSGLGAAVARESADIAAQSTAKAIAVRRDFSALATFAPEARTDATGVAQVRFKVPDSLTRYRIMAIAADRQQRFGAADAALTARRVLMVRPSPPRFLNFGDRAQLPVVVQNQGDGPIDVQVAMRGANVQLTGAPGYRVSVPVGDRREVRFDIATADAGQARFQIAAAAGPYGDAAEIAVDVLTPATTEAFATYGTTTEDVIRQPLRRPEGVVDGFGGLEITTASTQLQALTDAFVYLQRYPFGCTEQLASRVISVVALKDVLAAFETADLPPSSEILAAMRRDVDDLSKRQQYDGGWAFWTRRGERWPFITVHAMHALARAADKGVKVPADTMRRGRGYLRQIRQKFPDHYSEAAKQSIEAYALYVRAMMGELDERAALALIRRAGGVGRLPLEIAGWLYPILVDGKKTRSTLTALRRRLNNDATETAGEAHFVTRYTDGAHLVLHSNRRVDGLLLEGLLRDRPRDPLVPKLVRGLLAHRVRGRWTSTQENAWVLLALDRYFRAYERQTPDFVARMWLGDRFAGEQVYRGRSTDQHRWFVPMTELSGATDVLLAKTGAGRLYYRLGLKYAPQSLELAPMDRGFAITRRYEAIDDPGDVRRDPDGAWRIKAGALVRVRVHMVAPSRRYHVALVDALPAGLEALNPALAVTPNVPPRQAGTDRRPPWRRTWFDHQNIRDARVEAFASSVSGGVYRYDYVARATTPGRFVVPPAKAEQMYAPETFGRSGTDRVIVEDDAR